MSFTDDMILVPNRAMGEAVQACNACAEWWRATCLAEDRPEDIEKPRFVLVPLRWNGSKVWGIPTRNLPESVEGFLLQRLEDYRKPTVVGRDPLGTVFPQFGSGQ